LAARSPSIAVAHFHAEADPYHPIRNPGGYLNLGTAENRLVWDLLAPRLSAARPLAASDVHYAPLHGTPELRRATAALLEQRWHAPVDPESLVVVSGATAALDIAASALCDPGEAIVVPAPYYAAFDIDLVGRSCARLIPAPMASAQGFGLDASVIERVLTDARGEGIVVRALAITSPCNPVGHVYPPDVLRSVLEVAAAHGIDVIADEIYAHSVFGSEPFVSVLDPALGVGDANRIHVIWGFAKDFGLSGLKVGVLHTTHPEVRSAARALAYFAPTSTDTQFLLRELLADADWVRNFLVQSRGRLGASYARTAELLAGEGIRHIPAAAGFSIWIDLSAWLPDPTVAGEQVLWERIFHAARVNILPGSAFACPEPGWFRLCHATDPALVQEGVARLGHVLHADQPPLRRRQGSPMPTP
jgi:aspartate/methionine/tyrosine aminotransferase